jgi:hypothetical protein
LKAAAAFGSGHSPGQWHALGVKEHTADRMARFYQGRQRQELMALAVE